MMGLLAVFLMPLDAVSARRLNSAASAWCIMRAEASAVVAANWSCILARWRHSSGVRAFVMNRTPACRRARPLHRLSSDRSDFAHDKPPHNLAFPVID